MSDKIKISILEDGTIKVDTDKVSGPNHVNAEGFIRSMFSLAGGSVVRKLKHAAQHILGHAHSHDHDHEHHHHH